MAPSHYLNKCCLPVIISEVFWHSPEGNFRGNIEDIYPWYKFENYYFDITATSPIGRWVKLLQVHFQTYQLSVRTYHGWPVLTIVWVAPHSVLRFQTYVCSVRSQVGWGSCWRWSYHRLHSENIMMYNSLWLSNPTWLHRFKSTFVQVMAWCHQAPSHYLSQRWLTFCDSVVSMSGQFDDTCSRHQSLIRVWTLHI